MNILNIIVAILAFVRQYGALARPIIETELQALLASGKLTQAQYDALEMFLNIVLGPAAQTAGPKLSTQPKAADFRTMAGY